MMSAPEIPRAILPLVPDDVSDDGLISQSGRLKDDRLPHMAGILYLFGKIGDQSFSCGILTWKSRWMAWHENRLLSIRCYNSR